jgi:hypothetical protein
VFIKSIVRFTDTTLFMNKRHFPYTCTVHAYACTVFIVDRIFTKCTRFSSLKQSMLFLQCTLDFIF